jgi:hypothetical protein
MRARSSHRVLPLTDCGQSQREGCTHLLVLTSNLAGEVLASSHTQMLASSHILSAPRGQLPLTRTTSVPSFSFTISNSRRIAATSVQRREPVINNLNIINNLSTDKTRNYSLIIRPTWRSESSSVVCLTRGESMTEQQTMHAVFSSIHLVNRLPPPSVI